MGRYTKILSAVLTLAMVVMLSQPLAAGVPVVRNFPRSLYGAGAQNWAVAQDSLGRMYFGNRSGLLVYDSHTWRLWRLPNYSTVRSVFVDNSRERVYVGGSEEFGYFDMSSGVLPPRYKSLVETIIAPETAIPEIWAIHKVGNAMWFQSDFNLLQWDGCKTGVISVEDKITTSAIVGNRFYIGMLHLGLMTISGSKVQQVPGTEALRGKRIVSIMPYGGDGKMLIVTALDGLWSYDGTTLSACNGVINDFLRVNQAFCATYDRLTDRYAFGTVANGTVIANAADIGNPANMVYVNAAYGMQDNTVLDMAFDRDANLWLALDNGISYAVTNSAISCMPLSSSIIGAGYTSLPCGAEMLLGTNRGLYTIPYPVTGPGLVTPRQLLKGQVWCLDSINNDIFMGGDNGLWVSSGTGFVQVDGVSGTWHIAPLSGRDDMLMVSTYEGFVVLKRESGRWVKSHRIAGYNDIGGHFIIDRQGVLWLAHWMKGIYRMMLSDDIKRFSRVDLLTTADGLPGKRDNLISDIGGNPVFSTPVGFYRWNSSSSRFEPDSTYNKLFGYRSSARLYRGNEQTVWSVSPDNVWVAYTDVSGRIRLDTISFQPLCERLIPGFDHIRFLNGGRAIVASQDGFYEVATSVGAKSRRSIRLTVSAVVAGADSIVYTAGLNRKKQAPLEVSHDLNSLRFEMSMPEYRAENAVKFSFLMEDYDDDWSAWSSMSSKEYTRLDDGSYTLKVRARDSYSGEIATTEFEFTITPPWWRTTVAKIIYLILILGAMWAGIVVLRRSSSRAAREAVKRKEQEMASLKRAADEEALRKDYEIAHLKSQQLEIEIKHKSEELSNITMNVIRKNEILLDISAKLTKVQESLDTSADNAPEAKQLTRIQKLIQDNISHDDDWRSFTRNFDIVYENYTKRLTELHPELTPGDLRLCCYLKMGLSSKEIAPLYNISYRSVEMTRYRLRKKLGLSRETNLTDYLQKL